MQNMTLIALFVIAAGGAAVSMQAPINSALARHAGGPLLAAVISFGVGFIALGLAWMAIGTGSLRAAAAGPAWIWAGGLLGAYFVFGMIWGVPFTGVLTAISAMILGQMLGALAVDATGAFGAAVREIDAKRILAVILVVAGVWLSHK